MFIFYGVFLRRVSELPIAVDLLTRGCKCEHLYNVHFKIYGNLFLPFLKIIALSEKANTAC